MDKEKVWKIVAQNYPNPDSVNEAVETIMKDHRTEIISLLDEIEKANIEPKLKSGESPNGRTFYMGSDSVAATINQLRKQWER